MQRPLTVSQNVRVFVGAAAIAIGAMACGGGSNDTGAAGTSGGAGTNGGAGTGGGTVCSLADVNKIFTTATGVNGCTVTGACHDANGAAAGLDLLSADWSTKLVGHAPSATGGAAGLESMCANMNFVYLKAGSNPAQGLFIDKIDPDMPTPPCGTHMPNLFPSLTATQFACVKSFFTTLTTK